MNITTEGRNMNKVEEQIKQAEARYGEPMPEMYKESLYQIEAFSSAFNKIFGEPKGWLEDQGEQQQEEQQQQQEEEAQEEQEENGSS